MSNIILAKLSVVIYFLFASNDHLRTFNNRCIAILFDCQSSGFVYLEKIGNVILTTKITNCVFFINQWVCPFISQILLYASCIYFVYIVNKYIFTVN